MCFLLEEATDVLRRATMAGTSTAVRMAQADIDLLEAGFWRVPMPDGRE